MTSNETNKLREYLQHISINELCHIIRECIDELYKRLRQHCGFPRTIYVHGYLDDMSYPNVLFIGNEHNFNGEVGSAHTYKL